MAAASATKKRPTRSRKQRTEPPAETLVPPVLRERVEVEMDGNVAAELVRIVKVVSIAASRDDARELLTGVLFESDGEGTVKVVATDSYRLHVVTWKQDWPAVRAVIPASWLARVMPKRRLHAAWYFRLTIADGKITWEDLAAQERFTKALISEVNVPYPNVDKLIDLASSGDGDTEKVRAFNPKLLADIFKAADLFGGPNSYKPVRVTHLDPMRPCRFDVDGTGEVNGTLQMILMPVRVV